MTSILKVDTIQTAAGGTPTAADLGLNVSGSVLQVVRHTWTTQTAISTTGLAAVSGSSFSVTPKSSSSTLIMISDVSARTNGNSTGITFLHYVDGARVDPYSGYNHEVYSGATGEDIYSRPSKSGVYTNTSTATKTISLYAGNYAATDNRINFEGRFPSSTIVFEIAG